MWTLTELVNLQRISKDGGTSLIGLWLEANEEGNRVMIDLTMQAMVIQNRESGLNQQMPGQFPKPMVTKSDTDKKESNADRSRRLNTMRNIFKGGI